MASIFRSQIEKKEFMKFSLQGDLYEKFDDEEGYN